MKRLGFFLMLCGVAMVSFAACGSLGNVTGGSANPGLLGNPLQGLSVPTADVAQIQQVIGLIGQLPNADPKQKIVLNAISTALAQKVSAAPAGSNTINVGLADLLGLYIALQPVINPPKPVATPTPGAEAPAATAPPPVASVLPAVKPLSLLPAGTRLQVNSDGTYSLVK